MTAGTKTPATRSANFAIGAFDDVASSTKRMICARAVPRPTCSARIANHPLRLTVAPMTRSPGALSTGKDSPVSALSSTAPAPSMTVPSAGTCSPALMISTSPTATSAAGISTSAPPRRTRAVFGANAANAPSAAVVRPFARASRHLPNVMSVRIMAAPSK